jgi:hypothetical protein
MLISLVQDTFENCLYDKIKQFEALNNNTNQNMVRVLLNP